MPLALKSHKRAIAVAHAQWHFSYLCDSHGCAKVKVCSHLRQLPTITNLTPTTLSDGNCVHCNFFPIHFWLHFFLHSLAVALCALLSSIIVIFSLFCFSFDYRQTPTKFAAICNRRCWLLLHVVGACACSSLHSSLSTLRRRCTPALVNCCVCFVAL